MRVTARGWAARVATLLSLAALATAACQGRRSGAPHAPGADSFQSPPPGGGARDGFATAGGAGAGPAAALPEAAGADASARTVEDADIYKHVGATLYVLNAYRGLQLVDLTSLAAPRLVSQVPITGRPVDLYVRDTVAVVAVSDHFSYVPLADGSVRPRHGSRVLAVDVANPAAPRVLADLPMEGEVDQTRLVGDVLYVVTRRSSWYDWVEGRAGDAATVAVAPGGSVASGGGVASMPYGGIDSVVVSSFNLSDPAHPVPVATLELPASGWSTHAHVTDRRITLSFAGWDPAGPLTRFRLIDISDPGGALRAGATFSTTGLLQDRWGMDFDEATGLFRTVTAVGWNAGATLDIWSSPSPEAEPTRLSRLAIPISESLTAARFDGARVYVVTAFRSDPLWCIDASNPASPQMRGQLHMEGQLEFIEPRGDRLVALGHTPEAGGGFQLAVSLLDVSDLAVPLLKARAIFGPPWASIGASADDLRKAFIVLDPPPAGIGLVLVPLQGWNPTTYRSQAGTQLIDLGRDTLTLRKLVEHPGAVSRAFPLDAAGTRLAALSDAALQIVDATNRDTASELARLDLARPVATLAIAHGKAIELAGDWYRGAMELAVTDALDPDAAVPLARVDLGAPNARLLQDGDLLWILAHDGATARSWVQGYDVSDPIHPRARGRIELASSDAFGPARSWGFGDEAVLVGQALVVHHSSGLCYDVCALAEPAGGFGGSAGARTDQLRVYDLSDPDHPRLASTISLDSASWAWGLTASGSSLWLTHFEWSPDRAQGRYYLDRIDLSDPALPRLLPEINVPGIFFAASADGSRVYTAETWWDDREGPYTWLHALDLAGAKARLVRSVKLQGYSGGVAAAGGFAWTVATSTGAATASRLVAVELGSMTVASDQAVQGAWAWLRAVAGGKLFLDAGWREQGVLVYDLARPGRPEFQTFFRTPGWVEDVVVSGGRAYLPSGPYGVPMVDLGSP